MVCSAGWPKCISILGAIFNGQDVKASEAHKKKLLQGDFSVRLTGQGYNKKPTLQQWPELQQSV